MFKFLCVGPQWRGSNAGGLFRALSRVGHLIEIVDENYYLNLSNTSIQNKIISKLSRPFEIKEFNRAIIGMAGKFNPDIVLVYKGAFVLPETLQILKEKKIRLVNFYPDVSFRSHGKLLPLTLPLYDFVFTTKTFGIGDMKNQLGISRSAFIPHGFDPDIHRPLNTSGTDTSFFKADVSFIGGYSDKKALYLAEVKRTCPQLNLKIWGPRWENCKEKNLKDSIMGIAIHGDLYVLGIISSRINLGLLHEQVHGASSGDKITSRTFHIPGSGGFMLHEKTEEVCNYFEEDKESVFFETPEELSQKIEFYLSNNSERDKIKTAGYNRAWKDHKLDNRALLVVDEIKKMVLTDLSVGK